MGMEDRKCLHVLTCTAFGNTFNMTFGLSHRFVTLIKGCRIIDSFVLLAGFEFSMGVYGYMLPDAASIGLFLLLLG